MTTPHGLYESLIRRWKVLVVAASCVATGEALAGERITPSEMEKMTYEQQVQWLEKQLGPHMDKVMDAARRNQVPPRLLVTVIANELTDYGVEDQVQEKVNYSDKQTVGMAQTSVANVLKRDQMKGLISEEEITANMEQSGSDRETAIKSITFQKLNDPPVAIEVCAREVSRLMDQLSADPNGTWAKHFLTGPIDRNDPYSSVKPWGWTGPNDPEKIAKWEEAKETKYNQSAQTMREQSLAMAVTAAYNSESVLTAKTEFNKVFEMPPNPEERNFLRKAWDSWMGNKVDVPYGDALRHGLNAASLWAALLSDRNWTPEGADDETKPTPEASPKLPAAAVISPFMSLPTAQGSAEAARADASLGPRPDSWPADEPWPPSMERLLELVNKGKAEKQESEGQNTGSNTGDMPPAGPTGGEKTGETGPVEPKEQPPKASAGGSEEDFTDPGAEGTAADNVAAAAEAVRRGVEAAKNFDASGFARGQAKADAEAATRVEGDYAEAARLESALRAAEEEFRRATAEAQRLAAKQKAAYQAYEAAQAAAAQRRAYEAYKRWLAQKQAYSQWTAQHNASRQRSVSQPQSRAGQGAAHKSGGIIQDKPQ